MNAVHLVKFEVVSISVKNVIRDCVYTTCILCKSAPESRNHLFFECSFASQLWEHLMGGILRSSYSVKWDDLLRLLSDAGMEKKKRFCFRYTFQVTLYSLWREQNKRRHGEEALPVRVLSKLTDKAVRNKLSLIQATGVKGLENILQFWFATRV